MRPMAQLMRRDEIRHAQRQELTFSKDSTTLAISKGVSDISQFSHGWLSQITRLSFAAQPGGMKFVYGRVCAADGRTARNQQDVEVQVWVENRSVAIVELQRLRRSKHWQSLFTA